MTPDDIVRILQDLPARYPRLIALAWEVAGENGEIDSEKVLLHAQEVAEAVDEANVLKGASHDLLEAVLRCIREPSL